jgi:hypothetical protein
MLLESKCLLFIRVVVYDVGSCKHFMCSQAQIVESGDFGLADVT